MFAKSWSFFAAIVALIAYPMAAPSATTASYIVADANDAYSSSPAADVTFPIPAPPPPPGAGAENYEDGRYRNVTQPALFVYLNPDASKPHPAIILCPGGGYGDLNWHSVVLHQIPFFRSHGFTVLGLKYRLDARGLVARRSDATADVREAMVLVHQHAAEWNINPSEIGLLGVSAGSNAILNFLSQAAAYPSPGAPMPAFAVLLSPWPAHQDPSEFVFTAKTPPLFIASARDDRTAPEIFARTIAQEAQAKNGNVLYYAIDTGGHGAFVIGSTQPGRDWTPSFLPWFQKLF